MDPDLELASCRAFEMCFESVPGSIVQCRALLQTMEADDGAFSKAALGSIVVSALTTGFSAATISFE
jgi:hypothetical protein